MNERTAKRRSRMLAVPLAVSVVLALGAVADAQTPATPPDTTKTAPETPAASEPAAPAAAPQAPPDAADTKTATPEAPAGSTADAKTATPEAPAGSTADAKAAAPPAGTAGAPDASADASPAPADTPDAGAAPAADAPTAVPAAPGGTPGVIGAVNLPRDLSLWSMFTSADIVVKAVMVGLAFASVVTWTVWLAKSLELLVAKRRVRLGLAAISDERSLAAAAASAGKRRGIVPSFLAAAQHELRLSSDVSERDGIKERVASRLARLEAAAARDMNKGTGLLATIGSTAPFVGLFGTVWGIMNSFIGISKAQTTNLAVVAPGIAEALLATAVGLFAAIPAVIIYNQFARWIGGYKGQLGDAGAEVLRLTSRDLDRGIGVKERELAQAAE